MGFFLSILLFSIGLFSGRLFGQIVDGSLMHESMVKLIATGDEYVGRVFIVRGVLEVTVDGGVLYLSKDDMLYRNLANSIGIEMDFELIKKVFPLNGKFVDVRGTFSVKKKQDALDQCSGRFENLVGLFEVLGGGQWGMGWRGEGLTVQVRDEDGNWLSVPLPMPIE